MSLFEDIFGADPFRGEKKPKPEKIEPKITGKFTFSNVTEWAVDPRPRLPDLGVYKVHPDVELPKFGTEEAACFDLAYNPAGKTTVVVYTKENMKFDYILSDRGSIILKPGDRTLLPTGLIFEIPRGYSLRVHPRSGMAVKLGLGLANCEGVIDSDYFHESFLTVVNNSATPLQINPGERLAQGELVPHYRYGIVETKKVPEQKTSRSGGFGSTGV